MFTEDFSLFAPLTGFGVIAYVDGVKVSGNLFAEGEELNGVITDRPEFHTAIAPIKQVTRGDTVIIDNVTYKTLAPIKDGLGMVILPLEEQ